MPVPGHPYARPPTGELRRQTPRPVADWRGVKDCHPYGTSCAQRLGTVHA
ncbi:carboxylesterase family protein [Embleya sp. NPDC127516]